MTELLALLLLRAAQIREASYDPSLPDPMYPSQFGDYKISLKDATLEACKDYSDHKITVFLLLHGNWNETLAAAQETLDPKGEHQGNIEKILEGRL